MLTLLGRPTVNVLALLTTSISLVVPATVRVAPSATAVEVEPSVTLKLVVTDPPNEMAVPLTVIALLDSEVFGMDPSEISPVELL